MDFSWQRRGPAAPIKSDSGERWLFIVPHDDDAAIGAGLAIQAAVQAGCETLVAITTDGSLGYCDAAQQTTIAAVRAQETRESLRLLGDPGVRFLGFPDGDLFRRQGRRLESGDLDGGLQGAYARLLREFRPDRLFLCSSADLHPDHKIVYAETLISLFHAAGDIWPELGTPLTRLPSLHEFPVYCALPAAPDYMLTGDNEAFRAKLDAVAAYRSQRQISLLVDKLKNGGPREYFHSVAFDLYDPDQYSGLFETGTTEQES